MAPSARICPHCGGLNAADAAACYRCGVRLGGHPARALAELVQSVLGDRFPMTHFLAGLCGLVFVFSVLDAADNGVRGFGLLLGETPVSVALRFGAMGAGSTGAEPWRLLSAIFFHFGPLHLLFNLSALLHFGRALEERVGSARVGCLFVITGALGFLLSSLIDDRAITAGASGAIFGFCGALVGYLYAARDRRWKDFLVQTLVMGLIVALAFRSINNAAHLGGLLAGLPMGFAFRKERRPGRRVLIANLLATLLILASAASLVLAQASPLWKGAREIEQRIAPGSY